MFVKTKCQWKNSRFYWIQYLWFSKESLLQLFKNRSRGAQIDEMMENFCFVWKIGFWSLLYPYFFSVCAVRRIILGWSVAKITIIIFILRDGTSINKNIDNQGKETCAYESDHIYLISDLMMSSAINFCFLSFYFKEIDPIRRKANI